MTFTLLIIGCVSLIAQVALLRELSVAFFGVELIYILGLGIWLFATAMGAMAGPRTRLPSGRDILMLLFLFSLMMPLNVLFIRAGRLIFSGVPGAYLDFFHQMTAMILAMLPAGFLSGLLFQWAAKQYAAKGRTLAAAYMVESAGGLVGGLLATAGLHLGIQNYTLLIICSLAALMPFLQKTGRQKGGVLNIAAIGLALILLVLLWQSRPLDHGMTAWTHPRLLDSRDTAYGRVTVTKLHDQVSVFENNALVFETEGTEAEVFVHLAALQHEGLDQVLILGGSMQGLLPELLKHRPQHITDVGLNAALQTTVFPHLPGSFRDAFKHSSIRQVFADPRQFLRHDGRYDLILVGMPEPSSGQANRFYTQDFFALCAARLNPRGILALRLGSAENYWTPQLSHRTSSIYRALSAVFPHILILPGTTDIITASATPLPDGPEWMTRRLRDRNIQTRVVTPAYLAYLFSNDRFLTARHILQTTQAPANTDNRPICFSFAVMVWLSHFFPQAAFMDMTAITTLYPGMPSWWWLALPALGLLFLLCRTRPLWRSAVLVAVAGFLGMVLEAALVLHYQLKHGVLFQDIGILLTLFMAGLALGAAIIGHALRQAEQGKKAGRIWKTVLLAGFALLCLVVSLIMESGYAMGLIQTVAWLAVTGFLVAGLFASISLEDSRDQGRLISPLYAADLIGACVGSMLAGLILIPMLGLHLTAQAMLAIALLALLLV